MRAGSTCENIVFVGLFFVCLSRSEASALFVRGRHSLNKYCVTVYRSNVMLFLPFSSEGIAVSDKLEILLTLVARWRHGHGARV